MAFPPASSAATALRRFISLCDIAWKEGGAQGVANVARKSERRLVLGIEIVRSDLFLFSVRFLFTYCYMIFTKLPAVCPVSVAHSFWFVHYYGINAW